MKPRRNLFLSSFLIVATFSTLQSRADIFDLNGTTSGFGVVNGGSYDWWTNPAWSNTLTVDDGTATTVQWQGTSTVAEEAHFVGSGVAGENYTVRLGATGATDTYIKNFALNVNAAGTAAMTGAAGDVTIGNSGDAGKLILSASQSLGTYNGTLTVNNGINLNAKTMNFRGGNVVINGVVSGTGASKILYGGNGFGFTTGPGTLTLANTANTYVGRANSDYIPANITLAVTKLANGGSNSSIGTSSANIGINGGTLKYIGSTGAQSTTLGLHIASNGAKIDASGVTSADTISISGAPTYSASNQSGSISLMGTNTGANKIAFNYGNNGTGVNSLAKDGIGRWVLSGNNSFTGNITMGTNSGNLVVTNSNSLGTHATAKTVTNTSGSSSSPAGANLIELDNTGTGADIVLSNKIKFTTSGSAGVILNTAGNNTIAGDFNMTLGNGNTKIISNGGTLALTGTFTSNASNRELELAGSTTGNVFSGILVNGSATALLTKSGAGTWEVSGSLNTFTGNTKVTGGTLKLTNNLAIQNSAFDTSGAGTLDLTDAAITTLTMGGLIGDASTGKNLVLPSNVTTLTLNPTVAATTNTYVKNFSGGAAGLTLTKTGAGTQILGGTNSYSGDTVINAGSLQINTAGAIGGTNITMSGTGNSALLLNDVTAGSGKAVTIIGAGVTALYGALSTGSANVSSEWQGGVTIGATTLTRVGAQAGTLKISGNIGETTTGSALIVRNNTGITVLTGANTFSGNLSIFNGTLRVGGNSVGSVGAITSGPLGTGTLVAAASNATLTAEGSTARTILNPVTFTSNNKLTIGAATIDTGKLTFNAAFTRTGTNTITTNSDVELAGGATSSTLNRFDINNGTTTVSSGTYDLNSYLTVSTLATGPANYVQTGGTVTLSTNNGAYVGNVDSSSSAFTVSGGAFNVNGTEGLVMRFNGTATTMVSGAGSVSSTGTGGLNFAKTGSTGTFNLGDGTAFSGGTSINDGGTSGVFTTSKVARTAGTNANNIFNFNGGTLKASAANATFFGDNTNIAANVMAGGGIIDNGDFNITVGQNLLNGGGSDGGMVFKGTGTTTLTGTGNTYTGNTTVSAGKLVINCNITSSALTTVANGATIGGNGTTGAITVESGGKLAPGNSIDSLTASGNVTFNANSTFEVEIDTASSYDKLGLNSSGNLYITSGAKLSLIDFGSPDLIALKSRLELINYTDGTWNNGLFTFGTEELSDSETFVWQTKTWLINYDDILGEGDSTDTNGGNFVTLTVIPEPHAAFLGLLGTLALLRRRR